MQNTATLTMSNDLRELALVKIKIEFCSINKVIDFKNLDPCLVNGTRILLKIKKTENKI